MTAPDLRSTPTPTPEEAAAIVAALRLRARDVAHAPARPTPSRWLRQGRLEAVSRWPAVPPSPPRS